MLVLELPDDLYERIRRSALANNRSIEAEAIYWLDRALPEIPLEKVALNEFPEPSAVVFAKGNEGPQRPPDSFCCR
jgi:hypothetical protein